jgi:TonB family protein
MTLGKMASVLVALGCAVCLGQPGQAPASQAMFAKSDSGKVSRPPDCPAKFDDSLETNGIAPERRTPGVKQPKPVYTPEAEFSDKTRKEVNKKHLRPFFSVTLLSFVVDTDGHTRDLCVKRPGQFDSDEQAAKAVTQWRFEPATKDGQPVAIRISSEISFAMR